MDDTRHSVFRRRQNPDDTFDSICLSCFLTVATDCRERDLQALEAAHWCAPPIEHDAHVLENILRRIALMGEK